jgi:hypothetical protein
MPHNQLLRDLLLDVVAGKLKWRIDFKRFVQAFRIFKKFDSGLILPLNSINDS